MKYRTEVYRHLPVVGATIIGGVVVAATPYFGIETSGDALRYASRGERLLAELIDGTTSGAPHDLWTWMYLVPNLLVAAGQRTFGPSFSEASVALNVALFAVLAAAMFRFWRDTWSKPPGLAFLPVSVVLLTGLPGEVTKYNYSALGSDIVALAVIGAFVVALSRALLDGGSRNWLAAAAFAVTSLVTRPTGIVAVTLFAVALLDCFVRWWANERHATVAIARLVLFLAVPAVVTFLLWPALLSLNKAGHPLAAGIVGAVPDRLVDYYDQGMVVAERLYTYLPEPVSLADFARINLHRLGYYLVPLRSGYSTAHVALNVMYLVLLLSCLVKGWRTLGTAGPGQRALRFHLVLAVIYFALFHAMTFVEDWRYQLPMWPALWLLAGIGAAAGAGAALRRPQQS